MVSLDGGVPSDLNVGPGVVDLGGCLDPAGLSVGVGGGALGRCEPGPSLKPLL